MRDAALQTLRFTPLISHEIQGMIPPYEVRQRYNTAFVKPFQAFLSPLIDSFLTQPGIATAMRDGLQRHGLLLPADPSPAPEEPSPELDPLETLDWSASEIQTFKDLDEAYQKSQDCIFDVPGFNNLKFSSNDLHQLLTYKFLLNDDTTRGNLFEVYVFVCLFVYVLVCAYV